MKNIRLVIIALLCAVAQLAWAQNPITVTTEAELIAAVQTDNAQIQFANPISTTSLLEIKDSKTITIDLNGFTLDRGCTSRSSQVIVVRNGSTLNLSNGTLTGGWGGNGGALDIETNTTVNLNDVIISGNKADDRGGAISNMGTLNMTDSSISSNASEDHDAPRGGGGLFNYDGATATLTNVTITGNEAKVYVGGGICNYGTLTINGGTVTGNTAKTNGSGIWNASAAVLNMQGTLTVNDNVKADGLRSNLYLCNGAFIHVIGALTGSDVSVGMETLGTFTNGYSTYHDVHPASFFDVDQRNITSMALVNGEGQLSSAIPEGGTYYVERSWNDETKAIEAHFRKLESYEYTTLTGSDDEITLSPGYYVVKGNDVVYDDRIIFSGGGEHHLILCDGAKISAEFFTVHEDNTLYIYGQSDNTGKMINTYESILMVQYYAGIGGKGSIVIHGGTIDVYGGDCAAGIGGGYNNDCNSVTIYGGTINALGGCNEDGFGGAGIGGGTYGSAGVITIYGGTVTAQTMTTSSFFHWPCGAGIGCGARGNGGTITIYGGHIDASSPTGAGIGSGYDGNGADVTIHGGIVTARVTDSEGAGIGTGYNDGNITSAGKLTVTGGKVYAYGCTRGAGIGGGWDASGADVTISGGYVYAEGGKYAAGIGSGCEGLTSGGKQGGKLTVTGGYVEARGGEDGAGIGGGEDADGSMVIISGGEVRAYGSYGGAGIGGGEEGDGGNVTITGGVVVAKAGRNETGHRAIGPGKSCDVYGQLTIGDAMMVSSERIATAVERKNMCWYRAEARIEPCTHPDGINYSDNGNSLDLGCNYCSSKEPYTFQVTGNWHEANNWLANTPPNPGKNVAVKADATIPSGCCAHVGDITLDGGSITIADGGQLIHNNAGVTATVQKAITGHGGNNNGGWNFIASPMVTNITPAATNGFLTEDYDLYYYDEPAHYWRNFKPDGLYHGFDIEPQKGYLYASQANTTLNLSGTLQPSNDPVTISGLSHEASVLNGFNLVGNPFACNATITDGNGNPMSFYVIEGRNVVPNTGSTIIPPCTGVMVKATASGQSVTFTKTTEQQSTQPSQLQIMLSQVVEPVETPSYRVGPSTSSGTLVFDNAIVSFTEGSQLEKFYFGNDAKVYIPQGGKDYAIAFSEGQGEMPLNFKATENGEYTLTVNPEGVEMNYLHLIDNMTGADIDLLALRQAQGSASYTFTAKTTDYESRFRLMFVSNNEDGSSTGSEAFAFYSNGNWFITNEGEASLQVIDITGRILSSETVSGSVNKAIDVAPGVYILKLNDKVQKIVIR